MCDRLYCIPRIYLYTQNNNHTQSTCSGLGPSEKHAFARMWVNESSAPHDEALVGKRTHVWSSSSIVKFIKHIWWVLAVCVCVRLVCCKWGGSIVRRQYPINTCFVQFNQMWRSVIDLVDASNSVTRNRHRNRMWPPSSSHIFNYSFEDLVFFCGLLESTHLNSDHCAGIIDFCI